MRLKTRGNLKYYGGWGIETCGWLILGVSLIAAPYTMGISLIGLLVTIPCIFSGHLLRSSGKKDLIDAKLDDASFLSPSQNSEATEQHSTSRLKSNQIYNLRTGRPESVHGLDKFFNPIQTRWFLTKPYKPKEFYPKTQEMPKNDDSSSNIFKR